MIINFSSTNRVSLVKRAGGTKTLGGRSVCDLELVPQSLDASPFVPFVGQPIEVISGGAYLFSGSIESVQAEKLRGKRIVTYSVTCADHHKILDRRLCGQREWVNTTDEAIIGDICNTNLVGETVDGTTYVDSGMAIEKFKVDYATAAEAINELAKLSQRHWYMDHAKRIHYFAGSTSQAPISFANPTLNAQKITETISREGYSNKVIVRLSNYVRDVHTARFNGTGRVEEDGEQPDSSQPTDGTRKYFQTTYALVATPRIHVDGIEKTVGIDGVDSGKQWYWNQGSNAVRQDNGEIPISAGGTLYVEYTGQESVTLAAQNNTEIDLRNSLEGNSGIYESLQDSTSRVTGSEASQLVESILAQVDEHSRTFVVETDDYLEPNCVAVEPGQNLAIATQGYTSGNYLVRQIRWSSPTPLKYEHAEVAISIEAVSGPILGDAVSFFQALARSEGITATPGPIVDPGAPGAVEPAQPDTTGWSLGLGASTADPVTGEQMQRIDVTITRALTTNANYWRIWTYLGGAPPASLSLWEDRAAAASNEPSATVVPLWFPRSKVSQTLQVGLTASSNSFTALPSVTMPVKSVVIPALDVAPTPTAWSVTPEYSGSPINGFYRGRFAFTVTNLPASTNIAGISTQRKPHGAPDSQYEDLSGYQGDDLGILQAGGNFSWNQGPFSPTSWERPEYPEEWDVRLGVMDHSRKVTWHPTVQLLTLDTGGGFQVSALNGKLIGLAVRGSSLANLSRKFRNSDFEDGLAGWSTSTGILDETGGVAGPRCVRFVCNGTYQWLSQSLYDSSPGAIRRISARIDNSANSSTGSPALVAVWMDSNGVVVSVHEYRIVSAIPGTWQSVTFLSAPCPANASQLFVYVEITQALTSGSVRVDSVTCEEAERATDGVGRDILGNLIVPPFAITNAKLADAAVTASKLVDGSVTGSKILDGAIDGLKIAAGAVTSAKLADLAVEAAKLANSSVTATKIANAAVGSAAIAAAAIGTAAIADAAITSAKIGLLAVGTGAIQNAAITEAKISDLSVSTAKIQNAAITDAKIASLAVGKLTAGTATFSGDVIFLRSGGGSVEIVGSGVNITGGNLQLLATSGARANLFVTGGTEMQFYLYTTAARYMRFYIGNSGAAMINMDTDYSFISLGGQDSYIKAWRFRFGEYFTESLPLSSLTTAKTIPVYNAAGTYLGKVPVFL